MNRIEETLEALKKVKDRTLSRKVRLAALDGIVPLNKVAQTQQTGIFQHFRDEIMEYPTRESVTRERGGKEVSDQLYGVTDATTDDIDTDIREHSRSLSTRYSPDRVGVQARRIADGVYQDPYTNKLYDWNEGFKTEDGDKIQGGGVALQTDLFPR